MPASVATTPLTYNLYISQIATMAVVNTTTSAGVVVGVDAAFNAIINQMIGYAELRIQRDADLLALKTVNNTYSLTSGNNLLQVSTNDFVTLQTISIINGTARAPLLPVSHEFITNVYGDSSHTAPPQYFAMLGGDLATAGLTYNNVLVAPYPDQSYQLSINGTIRMPSLAYYGDNSSDATTKYTFISTWLPDLLILASMIYISMYQRNFSREADDPAMAQSYESQYKALLSGVQIEEARKKFQASAWSSMSPPLAATPTR